MSFNDDAVTCRPGRRAGAPCIRGTRITVADVLSYLDAGMSAAQIFQDFPELCPEDIRVCLRSTRTLHADQPAFSS